MMKTTKLFDGKELDKIGFGTWRIGGGTRPEPQNDERDLAALKSAIEIGYRHIDTAEYYADGHSEELVGQAIVESGIPREEFFITTKVQPSNLGYKPTTRAFERSLDHLGMTYIDLYLIHWPRANMPLEETCGVFNEFISQARLRYVGVSNFSVSQMKETEEYLDVPLLTNQTPLSVGKREYVRNGVQAYCQENDILLTAYSPIKDIRSGQMDTLREIGEKYGATPYQTALAWLVNQPNVITIPMSHSREHQQANFDAVQIELSAEDLNRITSLA
jgi:diketogulonate reductase-like aldo/keto reductase